MNEIKKKFQNYIEQGICNGAEWKVNVKNKIYHDSVGFRDLDKTKPLKKNLYYRIWSMTKPIVSLAAMQLIEKNYLSLEDTIDKYIKDFKKIKILKANSINIEDITISNNIPTIRQLLQHTAGFTYNSSDNIVGEEYEKRKIFHSGETSLEEEVNFLSELPLLFEPGSQWHYSVSIDILARILEIVTRENLSDILYENIFSILDMNSTGFFIDENQNKNVVETFEYSKENQYLKNLSLEGRKLINYSYPLNNKNYARGGHGLFSTAEDYSKFSNMLITGKNTQGHQLLNEKSLDLMRTNNLNPSFFPLEISSINTLKNEKYINDLDGYGWGLGFRVLVNNTSYNKYGTLGEFGWSGYASTYFMVDPINQISAVLMMQIIDGDRILKQDFYDSVFKLI